MEPINEKAVRKGAWTKEEDVLLKNCIQKYGEGKWHQVPTRAGLNRCRKSCRLRWLNYLRPDIKRDYFSKDEVDLIVRLHKLLGNRWSLIAGRLPGRTANHVKNFWNTHIINKSAAAKENRCSRPAETPANKAITNSSNIIRPRPRTLKIARAQAPAARASEAADSNNQPSSPNNWNSENPENNQQQPSPIFSREEVEECNLWWSSLLDMTENGDGTKSFSFSDFDSLFGFENSIPVE